MHGVRRQPGNGAEETVTVDIAIYQDDGRLAAAIEGLSLKPLSPEALRRMPPPERIILQTGRRTPARQSEATPATRRRRSRPD